MLSIVVPTYNERGNLRALIDRTLLAFASLGEDAELIIVDDNSPDGTAQEARRIASELGVEERVRVVLRTEDRGLSKSVVEGFRQARGDVLAVMDADLSHPPEVIPDLLEPIRQDEADIVVGSRCVAGGGIEDWPITRRFTSWSAGLLARLLTPVRDTTSGCFAVRKSLLESVDLKPRGYKIALDVLVRTGATRVREVPLVFTDRTAGSSKLGSTVMLAYLQQLGELYRIRFPRASRYVQFALVGCVGMVVDAVLFLLLFRVLGTSRIGFEGGHFLAQGFAFAAALWVNFRLNRRFTFAETGGHGRLTVFASICVGGAALRYGVAALAAGGATAGSPGALWQAGFAGSGALAAGLLVASVWNFFASSRWAFAAPGPGDRQPEAATERRARRAVWGLLVGFVAFHALYGGSLSLGADEAYYWQWSRGAHLAVGYHDHPPFVAYMIRLGTMLAGDTHVGVRIVNTLFLAGFVWLVVQLTRLFVRAAPRSEQATGPWVAGLWAGGACLAAPVIGLNGLLAQPDTPLLFFWTATVALTLAALARERIALWLAVGVTLGLGMLSKYQMALLPPSLLIALLLSARGRRALRGPGPYLAVGLGALLCVPFLRWVIESDLAGLKFQAAHGLGGGQERAAFDALGSIARFLGGQALALSPVLGCFLAWFLVREARALPARSRRPASSDEALAAAYWPVLVVPSVVVLAVFLHASMGARPEMHWASVAYPTAFVIAGPIFARWYRTGGQWRMHACVAVGVAALMTLAAHVEVATPVLMKRGFFTKIAPRGPFAKWFEEARQRRGPAGQAAPVLTDSYQTASLLAFYLHDHPLTSAPFESGSGQQYQHWKGERPLRAGQPAWFVTMWKDDHRLPTVFSEYSFDSTHTCMRLGTATHTYYAYYGVLRSDRLGP